MCVCGFNSAIVRTHPISAHSRAPARVQVQTRVQRGAGDESSVTAFDRRLAQRYVTASARTARAPLSAPDPLSPPPSACPQLFLFDSVNRESSEHGTLADFTIMVLMIFGSIHLITMPYVGGGGGVST